MPPQVEVSVASSPQKQQGKPFLNVDAEKPEECLIFLQRATYLSIVQVLHLRKLLRQKAFTKRYFEDEPFYVLNNMTSAGRRMYNKLKGPLDAVRKRALSKIVLQLRARDGHDYDDDEYANLCNEAWTIQLTYGSSGSVQIIRESDGAAMGKLKYNGPGSLENATFELLHELKSIGQVLHPLPSVVDHYFRVYCNQSEYQMDGYKTVSGPLLVSGDGYLCISKMMLNHGSMLFDIQSEFLPSIESAAEGLKRVEEKRKPANILDESLFSDPGVPQAKAYDPEVPTIEAMVPRTPFTPKRTADFPEILDFDAFNMILQAPADEELFSEPFVQPGFQDPVDTLYGITSLNTEASDSQAPDGSDDKLENPRLATSKAKVTSPTLLSDICHEKDKTVVCGDADNTSMAGNVDTDPVSKPTEMSDESSLPRPPARRRKLPPSVVKKEVSPPLKRRGLSSLEKTALQSEGSAHENPRHQAPNSVTKIFNTSPLMESSLPRPPARRRKLPPSVVKKEVSPPLKRRGLSSPEKTALQSEGSAHENPRHQAPNSVTKIFNTSPLMSISSTLQTETSAEAHADQQGPYSVTKYFATTPVMSVSSAQSSVVNPTHQNKYFSTSPIMPLSPASDRSRIGAAGSRENLDGTLMTERIFATSPIMGLSPASSLANSVQEVPLQPAADVVTKFFNTSPLMSISSTLQTETSAEAHADQQGPYSVTKYFVTTPVMSVSSAQSSVVNPTHQNKYFSTSPIMPLSPASDRSRIGAAGSRENLDGTLMTERIFATSPIMGLSPASSLANSVQEVPLQPAADVVTKFFNTSPLMPRSPISDGRRFSDTESGTNPHTAPLDQHFFCSSPIMKMN
ncbi:unnamed protein product, partial [Mesorhabditis spiculigera]